MKKLLLVISMLISIAYGQSILYFRADTSLFYKMGGSHEFKLQNSTRAVIGPLVNIGDGKTRFMSWVQIGDSIGGADGNYNLNVGAFYRLAIPYTPNIKTLEPKFGIIIDSVLANVLGIKFDSSNIHTEAYNDGKYWRLTGNNGTTAGTNFVGTLDNQDLVVKRTSIEGYRMTTGGASWWSGNTSTGVTPTSGTGSRMMWIPAKAAGRIGRVENAQSASWDEANIGDYSFAANYGTKATGSAATAFGSTTLASGLSSFAIGYAGTSATGAFTFASGYANTASGNYSSAIGGIYNNSSGDYSFASGNFAKAAGDFTFSLGLRTYMNTVGGIALGNYNDTTGYYLHRSLASFGTTPNQTDAIFVIGNGTATDYNNGIKRNALQLYYSGILQLPKYKNNIAGDSILSTDTSGRIIQILKPAGGSVSWGAITGTLSNQTDLQNALNLKSNIASPTFTGVPAAPTAAPGTNTTQIATTAFVLANAGSGGGVAVGQIVTNTKPKAVFFSQNNKLSIDSANLNYDSVTALLKVGKNLNVDGLTPLLNANGNYLPTETPSAAINNSLYNMTPLIVTTAKGVRIMFYRQGTTHAGDRGKIVRRKSFDDGTTWGTVKVLAADSTDDLRLGGSGGITPTGRIIIFIFKYRISDGHSLSQTILYSDDDAETISDTVNVPSASETDYSPYGPMLRLAGDTLGLSWYGITGSRTSIWIAKFVNDGTTFVSNTLVDSSSVQQLYEPAFVTDGDRNAIGVVRNDNNGSLAFYKSSDNATTFTAREEAVNIDNFTAHSPVWLNTFASPSGKRIAAVYYGKDTAIKVVYGWWKDLITIGAAGWQAASRKMVAHTSVISLKYPSVDHPYNLPAGLGVCWGEASSSNAPLYTFVTPLDSLPPLSPTGGGGGSTSPAGNYGDVQINRNSQFATPGSDSLQFVSAGLIIKGKLTVTGLSSGASTDSAVTWNATSKELTKQPFQSVLLTSIADGDMLRYQSSTGYFVNTKLSGGAMEDFYTDVNNSGTSETDLYTYTTPANTLNVDGEKIYFEYAGTFNDATSTPNLKVYFGGTQIYASGALTLSATGAWSLKGFLIRTSSTTVRAVVTFSTPTASSAPYTIQTDLTGLTLSATNIIKCTATVTGATGGSNDATAKLGTVSWNAAAL